jgi:membrane dipeptidase
VVSRFVTFASFAFGLTAAQEERAARLHRDSTIIDLLFQGPCGYRSFTPEVLELVKQLPASAGPTERYFASVFAPIRAALEGRTNEFRECWERSGITAGNRQVGFGAPAYAIAQAQFDKFPWLVKALTAADIRAAKAAGKRAGFVSTQDSDGLQDRDLDHLRVAHDFGLRMMGLSYNVQNAVAGGLADRGDGGVTAFGVEVIRKMDELGIIIDMSHSSRQATLDACALSKNPVVVSHASAAKLHDIARAKSDEEIQAIAQSSGVFGIAAVPGLLTARAQPTIEVMLDHIDCVAQLVGWRHVAIGTDWPLQADRQTLDTVFLSMKREYAPRTTGGGKALDSIETPMNLDGFDDYRDFPNITRGLVARGYSDEQIRGILGENFLRVFEAVCG